MPSYPQQLPRAVAGHRPFQQSQASAAASRMLSTSIEGASSVHDTLVGAAPLFVTVVVMFCVMLLGISKPEALNVPGLRSP